MAEANVGSTELIPISEHNRVLMAMHKAMRADSQRLIAAAAALPDGDTGAAAALGRAFAAIVGLIHDHHWTEDDVMYPFLLDRVKPSSTMRSGWKTTTSSSTQRWPGSTPDFGCSLISSAPLCGETREATSWTRRQPSTACWSITSTARRTWSFPHSNR
jgi:Hemerythrin HHE cation binding domain